MQWLNFSSWFGYTQSLHAVDEGVSACQNLQNVSCPLVIRQEELLELPEEEEEEEEIKLEEQSGFDGNNCDYDYDEDYGDQVQETVKYGEHTTHDKDVVTKITYCDIVKLSACYQHANDFVVSEPHNIRNLRPDLESYISPKRHVEILTI